MAGVLRPSKESPLICYAIRKLNPEIFSHPVWVRFWAKDKNISPEAVQDLYEQAEQLQRDSPGDACQLLLICAVCESSSGCLDDALSAVQQALSLAERNRLSKEIIWAKWGACAIRFQQENFEQATRYLEELETVLTRENEWVLADFVDVIRQSLCQPEIVGAWRRAGFSKEAASDLLLLAFQWLQKWGYWNASNNFHRWGMRLNGHEDGEKQFSIWESIRSLLGLSEYQRKIESSAEQKDPQRSVETVLEAVTAKAPPQITSPRIRATARNDNTLASHSKPVLANDTAEKNHATMDVTTCIPMAVHMLGTFELMIGEKAVKLPLSRGVSLLQYLLLHHRQHTSREVLMDIFWPDAEPETARNNLNVAIHGLRTALRSVIFLPVIIFDEGTYGLAPDLHVWFDVEEFDRYVKSGNRLEAQKELNLAVTEYETAISLYQGDFLDGTPYESWTVVERERLRIAYLDTLARLSQIYFSQERYAGCVTFCQLILARDRCREDAHCRLMQCYSRLGQTSLALRQYQICVEALQVELEVDPAPETTRLYERIHRHEQI